MVSRLHGTNNIVRAKSKQSTWISRHLCAFFSFYSSPLLPFAYLLDLPLCLNGKLKLLLTMNIMYFVNIVNISV